MNQKNVLDSVIGEVTQLENYIQGWKNSGRLPAIEKDLVLHRLQQVYDQVKQLTVLPVEEVVPAASPVEAIILPEPEITAPGPVEEIIFEKTSTIIEEKVASHEIPLRTEHLRQIIEETALTTAPVTLIEEIRPTENPVKQIVEEVIPVAEPLITKPAEKSEEQITPMNEPVKTRLEVVPKKHTENTKVKETSKEILAEKLSHPQKVINETVKAHATLDVSSKLKTSPIPNIQSAINLNDKFVFIRELFKNNSLLYHQTIDRLNNAQSFEAAMMIIDKEFAWDLNDSLVIKLVDLIKRKHNA